jgi:hypothetical protein
MRWLLFFYPRAWRRRYGEEYLALLEDVGPSPKVVADALLGAVSAHLSGAVDEAPAPQPVAAAAPPVPPSPTPRPFQNRRPDQFEGAIDQLIREGRERGLFDNLPGTGKPLPLGDENPFAGEWALAFKILKQSGETLPWIALGHEVEAALARLDADLATTANRLRRLRTADPAGYPADRAQARAAYLAAAADVDTKLAQYARLIPHPHFDRGRLTPPTAAHRFDRAVD